MKYIRIFLVILLGFIYVPLNHYMLKIQKWYLPLWHTDRVLYFLVMPFYWIYVVITFAVAVPYDFLIAKNLD